MAKLKGEDTVVSITKDGVLQNVTSVRSLEITFNMAVLDAGYLGEGTNQKDDVFNGVSGSVEIHLDDDGALSLVQAIIDRAQRRAPGVKFGLQAALNFPNGRKKRVQVGDMFFEDIPLAMPERGEFATLGLSFQAPGARFI